MIRAAMLSPAGTAAGLAELFPRKAESRGWVFKRGGPAARRRVSGTGARPVRAAADHSSVVSFVETWDGRSFRGPGSAAKPGLSHTWEFHLTVSEKVTGSRSFGDFPPQSVK
jgi:hypothetical protein